VGGLAMKIERITTFLVDRCPLVGGTPS